MLISIGINIAPGRGIHADSYVVGNNDYRGLKGQVLATFLSLTQDQQVHFFYMMEMDIVTVLGTVLVTYVQRACIAEGLPGCC